MKRKLSNIVPFNPLKLPQSFVLAFVAVLMPFMASAQLTVNDNTFFTVEQELSSAEQTNTFKSDFLGDSGTLYLVGTTQTLQTFNQSSLSNLVIFNASELSVLSALNIKGNLTIKKGALKLNHQLLLHGRLLLLDNALVHNEYLITFVEDVTHFQKADLFLSINQNVIGLIFCDTSENKFFKPILNKGLISAQTNFYKSCNQIPLHPPPLEG